MKVGAKEMKKAYKNIKIDKIEVLIFDYFKLPKLKLKLIPLIPFKHASK